VSSATTDDRRPASPASRDAARPAWRAVLSWFDASATQDGDDPTRDRVDWARILPFVGMHVACLAVFWVGVSPFAVGVAVAMYLLRMFAITGFYHRYFSHRSFKTSRAAQFVFAVLGASAVQRGPIWWAAHHRHHHAHSDRADDVHSPKQRGFVWSHMGWFLSRRHFAPDLGRVRDLLRYPELRWLDRFDILVPFLLALGLLLAGQWLEAHRPELGVTGGQLLVWGFFVSTVACYHGTYTINSLCHVWGRRRYATGDESRNNFWLALITLGEGWHNNHHRYPMSVRQGFYWWEIDITYYLLRVLAAARIIWDLKPVPREVREAHTAVAS
jgi:stearoyl-CoA desaturase (delta-9 desaturase)